MAAPHANTRTLRIETKGEDCIIQKDQYQDLDDVSCLIINSNNSGGLCYIEAGSFAGMKNLHSLEIKGRDIIVCEGAFEGCKNLETVTITSKEHFVFIDDKALANCDRLRFVSLSGDAVQISPNTFLNKPQNAIVKSKCWGFVCGEKCKVPIEFMGQVSPILVRFNDKGIAFANDMVVKNDIVTEVLDKVFQVRQVIEKSVADKKKEDKSILKDIANKFFTDKTESSSNVSVLGDK